MAGNAHNEPRTDEEWLEYVQRDDVDSIRSRSDWDRRLRDGDFRGKLFLGCDDETVEEFSNGLVFRDGVFAGGGAVRNRDRAAGRSINDHLLDSGGITASAYQVKQLPSAVVIDRRGRVTQPAIAGQAAIAATIEQLKADKRELSSR